MKEEEMEFRKKIFIVRSHVDFAKGELSQAMDCAKALQTRDCQRRTGRIPLDTRIITRIITPFHPPSLPPLVLIRSSRRCSRTAVKGERQFIKGDVEAGRREINIEMYHRRR